jgi:NAD(P)-dependent dehydrogenase (short-subunit alcohol dehydrogenase family)
VVVEEIRAAGGQAIANGDDVADFAGAERMVAAALDAFGGLDAVVNNAGFVRDRMFANAAEDEWDAVVRVHLKGHFAVARHAAAFWRDQAKTGRPVDARIVNTSSGAGILGSVGQAAYSAAKAGIATLTLVQAAELGRYGVTANALCPAARTRMTEGVFTEMMATPDAPDAFDAMAPENVSPLVAWLVSAGSAHVTGRMFEVEGGKVGLATGWQHGPTADKGARWEAAELGPVVDDLLAQAPAAAPVYGAT